MFEPHDDKHDDMPHAARAPARIAAILGFVVGFGIGWLVWDRLVLPPMRSAPTAENPSGDPAQWLYYGSLIVCLGIALFIVAVLGEWLGSRRRARVRTGST